MRRSIIAILLASAICAPAEAARRGPRLSVYTRIPPYQRIYGRGFERQEIGDWENVVDVMRQSIAANGVEGGERVPIPGKGLAVYIPNYYLGLAYFNLACRPASEVAKQPAAWPSRCADSNASLYALSVAAFEESARQPAIHQLPGEYAILQDLVARARFRAGVQRLGLRGETKPPNAFTALFDSVGDPLARFTIDHHEDIVALRRGMKAIRRSLGARGTDDADDGVVQIDAAMLARMNADADRKEKAAQALRSIDAAKSLLILAGSGSKSSSDLAARARDLQDAIAKAEAVVLNGSIGDMEFASARLDAAMITTRQALATSAVGGPPPLLFEATASFFAGDYSHAAALLESATFDEAKARAHARLILAAARFAIYRSGGSTDTSLLAKAAEDVKACRKEDPKLAPNGEFSKAFQDFFARTL